MVFSGLNFIPSPKQPKAARNEKGERREAGNRLQAGKLTRNPRFALEVDSISQQATPAIEQVGAADLLVGLLVGLSPEELASMCETLRGLAGAQRIVVLHNHAAPRSLPPAADFPMPPDRIPLCSSFRGPLPVQPPRAHPLRVCPPRMRRFSKLAQNWTLKLAVWPPQRSRTRRPDGSAVWPSLCSKALIWWRPATLAADLKDF